MAYRIVNEVDADPTMAILKDDGSGSFKSKTGASSGQIGHGEIRSGGEKKMDEDEERDAVFFRLEMLGYRVGQGLVERYVFLRAVWLWAGWGAGKKVWIVRGEMQLLEITVKNRRADADMLCSQIFPRSATLH